MKKELHPVLIPIQSPVYQTLVQIVTSAKVVVFSGLPGVGKSLYINQFKAMATNHGKTITVIQWDVARKAFETPEIAAIFPMGDGVVHNGVKLSVGTWLMDTLKQWIIKHTSEDDLLIIEAPFVGHRFVELAKIQEDDLVEAFLKSADFQVIVPIPSKEVRAKIEEDRKAQISDDAKVWTGAKPAVMLMLWKMLCGIANEFGKAIPMEGQPPYEPTIYEFVFSRLLQHRHFIPLVIDEIFDIDIKDEQELHNTGSLKADKETANNYAFQTNENFSQRKMNAVVEKWYLS